MRKPHPLISLSLFIFLVISSCVKSPEFAQNESLEWSNDTVYFDTIFTRQSQTGNYPISVTKILSVKNPSALWVNANFEVAGGDQSSYKINVDGLSGSKINNIEIAPNDSVFVFVQCALEANKETQPALVLDSIWARVGTRNSKIMLAAYGWDAHYVRDSIIPNNTVWSDASKPYVIIDGAYVAPNSKWTWKEGIQVYASARSGIYVYGEFNIEGSKEARVSIQGDKPVFSSKTLPNQWYGIYFAPGGKGNIKYGDITNASFGVRTDSLAQGNAPSIRLSNTRIQYCGQTCLVSLSGGIEAENCLFADAGSYTFLGYFGGWYNFNHCTFADHSQIAIRRDGHFGMTNTLRDGNGYLLDVKNLTFSIENSIIWGNRMDEVALDKVDQADFNFNSSFTLFRTKNEEEIIPKTTNYFNLDPLFEDHEIGNFSLTTTSPALEKANPASGLSVDLFGNSRGNPADIGAIETE